MKIELEGHTHQRQSLQLAAHGNQRVFFTGGALRRGKAVAIALLVLELEAVYRFDLGEDFLPVGRIQEDVQATPRADAHVVIALGTDVIVALEIRAVEHGVALDAFLPQSLGHVGALFTLVTAHAGRQNLVYPAHGKPRCEEGAIINAPRVN